MFLTGSADKKRTAKAERRLNPVFGRYLVCLVAVVVFLQLWWSLDLQQRQAPIRNEWAVESSGVQSADSDSFTQSFIATAERQLISGIGLSNDDADKSVFDQYEPRIISGTAAIRDQSGNVIWSEKLTNLEIPTWKTEELNPDDLSETPILLKEGETYRVSIVDANGDPVQGVTWTFYGTKRSFYPGYCILCAVVLVLLSVLYFQYQSILHLPFPALWIGGLILFSLVSMLALAPTCVPDEELHFGSSYAISNRIMNAVPFLRNRASEVPTGVLRYVGFGSSQYLYHFWSDWNYGNVITNHAGDYHLEGIMPHYAYVVPAVGVTLARIVHAPYQLYVVLARMMNALFYGLVTLLAVRVNPRLKPAVIAITWIPSTLWIVNSCSYDVWNLAFCILFVCWCDRIGRQDRIRVREYLIALFLFVLFVPIKFIYFNFILFLLLLRLRNLAVKNPKRVRLVVVLVIIAAFTAIIAALRPRLREALTFLGAGGFDARAGMTWESSYTLGYVLRHPATTILMYLKTLYTDGPGVILTILYGDRFSSYIPVILKVGILAFFILTLLGISEHTSGNIPAAREKKAIRREKVFSWVIILSGIVIVMSSFLFVYTPVSSSGIGTIRGLQGRYFLPYLAVVPFILPGWEKAEKKVDRNEMILAALTTVTILTRFGGVIVNT